jgi:hypothetical protein
VPSLAVFVHQVRPAQQPQMLRDGRTGNRKCVGNLPGWLASLPQQVEQGAACGIG